MSKTDAYISYIGISRKTIIFCGRCLFAALLLNVQGCLIFYRIGYKVLLDHQGNLKDDCIIKLAEVKTCQTLNLFKTIDQGIAVYKQLAGFRIR